MINYTERLALLAADIVARVPTLSFIDPADVLLFARSGRSDADGPFATCHCLTLPPSEQGYYFWRDRKSGRITRRSEWFVTKSPLVSRNGRHIKYMISFALPRFCDQSLTRTSKQQFYPADQPWMAKLDTVVHELYHIDPDLGGIRRIVRADGSYAVSCHGTHFLQQVADMVTTYLASNPDPAIYEFLRHDFSALDARFGGVTAMTFRTFPSFPQRYIERVAVQASSEADAVGVVIERLTLSKQPTTYTDEDLLVRQFFKKPAHVPTRQRAA
jgi:hypothetical protein